MSQKKRATEMANTRRPLLSEDERRAVSELKRRISEILQTEHLHTARNHAAHLGSLLQVLSVGVETRETALRAIVKLTQDASKPWVTMNEIASEAKRGMG